MKIKFTPTTSDVPSPFAIQHAQDVTGVLCGFDRLRLMATLRLLYQPSLMLRYLSRANILLKDFAGFAGGWTERGRAAAHQLAEQHPRPLTYLHGSSQRKELLARDLARHDGLTTGLVGIWSEVEPCLTYFVRRDREQKQLILRLEPGKCLHYYFYFLHEQLGLLHLRLQTWFPFAIHLCLNGRHWLARQLDQHGIDYVKRENCFPWIEDVPRAQALARAQLQSHWPTLLQPLVEQGHPHAAESCRPLALSYYWSVSESEYATDMMFKTPAALARLYPALIRQGIQHFGSTDVLRFLGHKTQVNGRVHDNHQDEVLSRLNQRPEGLRLKHQANGNSIKLYDKQGSVLRVETTLNGRGLGGIARNDEMLVGQFQRGRRRFLGRFGRERKDGVERAAGHVRFNELRVIAHQRHLAVVEIAERLAAQVEVPRIRILVVAVTRREHLPFGFQHLARIRWYDRVNDVGQSRLWWSARNIP